MMLRCTHLRMRKRHTPARPLNWYQGRRRSLIRLGSIIRHAVKLRQSDPRHVTICDDCLPSPHARITYRHSGINRLCR
jgi:hypothetical protein